MRALLWPLSAQSAWDLTATVVAGMTGEGDNLALTSVLSVGVGSSSLCGCGNNI